MSISMAKRQRERERAERQRDKALRRKAKRTERGEPVAPGTPGEDPDLAGIVAGPQPPAEEP